MSIWPGYALEAFRDETDSYNFAEYEALVARCPTFESFWEVCDRPQWMLHTLRHSDNRVLWMDSLELRSFACWCARNTLSASDMPLAERLIETAEEFILGGLSKEEMLQRAKDVGSGASAAGVIGLPKLFPNAAALLSCYHTCDNSALDAADMCSSFAARTARYVMAWECSRVMLKDDSPDYQAVISVASKNEFALDAVTNAALATQAHKLREFIPRPEEVVGEMNKLGDVVIPLASRKIN